MLDTTLATPHVTQPLNQDQLPYDDGEPMESQRHKLQMDLLIDAITIWLRHREDGFVGGNMFVYYSKTQNLNKDFKGPDFFVALGVPKGERKSWVIWAEAKSPDVVIELLSESTAETDKNEKKLVYQDEMKVGEYFWFDPFNPKEWAGFIKKDKVYEPIAVNSQNQLVSEALGLALQRWHGSYKDIVTTWLRWATLDGELLPTSDEIAEQEKQRAEQEKQRAEQEKQRAEQAESVLQQVASNLHSQGMALEQIASLTGLSESQVEQLLDK